MISPLLSRRHKTSSGYALVLMCMDTGQSSSSTKIWASRWFNVSLSCCLVNNPLRDVFAKTFVEDWAIVKRQIGLQSENKIFPYYCKCLLILLLLYIVCMCLLSFCVSQSKSEKNSNLTKENFYDYCLENVKMGHFQFYCRTLLSNMIVIISVLFCFVW